MSSTQAKFSPLFSRHAPGGPFTVSGIDVCPGDIWFVDSAATNAGVTTGHGRTPEKPFSTLAYAFSSDLVGSGDTVYLMPSHAESVIAAGTITMDIAGVKVVGLGQGATRPTFTFTTVNTATWLITAASCSVENVIITCSGTVDFASCITVTAADVTLADLDIRDSAADSQFVDTIILHTGAARARVLRPRIRSIATGDAAQSGILISAAVDGVEIEDPIINGLYATGCIESTAAATNTIIRDAICQQRHGTADAAINLHANNTGFVLSPRVRTATDDADGYNGALVGADMQWYNPLVVNADGEQGGVSNLAVSANA